MMSEPAKDNECPTARGRVRAMNKRRFSRRGQRTSSILLPNPPSTFPVYVDRIEGWLEIGMTEEAEREYLSLTSAQRQEPDAIRMRVHIEVVFNRTRRALTEALRLARRQPKNPASWMLVSAVCLHPCHRVDWALRALKQGLLEIPEEPNLPFAFDSLCNDLGAIQERKSGAEA